MQNESNHSSSLEHTREANARMLLTAGVPAVIIVALYLWFSWLGLRTRQLVEAGFYLVCLGGSIYSVFWYHRTYKKRRRT